MINVDFYLLSEPSITACGRSVCRLVEKIYKDKKRVYIYVDSDKTAQYFNDLLWTFGDISFVPHNIYEENINSSVPIQIGCVPDPKNHNEILINLTENVPTSYANFQTLLEIIPGDETLKVSGRKKYKFYQSQKCVLQVHE
jgi:DNA polymerase III subunit chi